MAMRRLLLGRLIRHGGQPSWHLQARSPCLPLSLALSQSPIGTQRGLNGLREGQRQWYGVETCEKDQEALRHLQVLLGAAEGDAERWREKQAEYLETLRSTDEMRRGFRSGDVVALQEAVRGAVGALMEQGRSEEAAELLLEHNEAARGAAVSLDGRQFEKMIQTYLEDAKSIEAGRVLKEMAEVGVVCDEETGISIVRADCETGDFLSASSSMLIAKGMGLSVGEELTDRVLLGLCDSYFPAALTVIKELERRGETLSQAVVEQMVTELCDREKTAEAEAALLSLGSRATPRVLNAVIGSYCQRSMLSDARRVLADAPAGRDFYSFLPVLLALCLRSAFSDVRDVLLGLVRSQEVDAPLSGIQEVVSAVAGHRRGGAAATALVSLLAEEREEFLELYVPTLRVLLGANHMESSKQMVRAMREKGIAIPGYAYVDLVALYLDEDDYKPLEAVLRDMDDAGVSDKELLALVSRQPELVNTQKAEETIKKMWHTGLSPTPSLVTLTLRAFRKTKRGDQGISLLHDMLKEDMYMTRSLLFEQLCHYAALGNVSFAERVVKQIRMLPGDTQGQRTSENKLRMAEIREARHFCDSIGIGREENDESGGEEKPEKDEEKDMAVEEFFVTKLTVEEYNELLHAYSRSGNVDGAEEVVKRMRDSGVEGNWRTYLHLAICHARVGSMERATEVAEKVKGEADDLELQRGLSLLYQTRVTGHCVAGDREAVLALLEEMRDKEMRAVAATRGQVVKTFLEMADVDGAATALRLLTDVRSRPRKAEFLLVLDEWVRQAKESVRKRDASGEGEEEELMGVGAVDDLQELMEVSGFEPDAGLVAALVRAYGVVGAYSEIEAIGERKLQSGGVHPTVLSAMFSAFSQRTGKEESVRDLWQYVRETPEKRTSDVLVEARRAFTSLGDVARLTQVISMTDKKRLLRKTDLTELHNQMKRRRQPLECSRKEMQALTTLLADIMPRHRMAFSSSHWDKFW